MIGRDVIDKPRNVLCELARSEHVWERRTAIVSTYYFIRQGDVADTFEIAEILDARPALGCEPRDFADYAREAASMGV